MTKCHMSTSGNEIGTQAERWKQLGRDAGFERVETKDGLQIRFRDVPTVEEELRALAAAESKCCSCARWEVRHADGDLVLKVGSTPEGAAALHAMFGTGAAQGHDPVPACRPPVTALTCTWIQGLGSEP
jgi:hypothetical protein